MKKIATLLAALLISVSAFANEWIFGIEAGGNIAYLNGEGFVPISGQYVYGGSNHVLGGGFLGGTAQYHFDNSWGLRGEIYYSQQGTKLFLSTVDYGNIYVCRRSNFINVPVMGYITFNRFTIMAGPSFDFCVSGKDYFGSLNSTAVPDNLRWSSSGFNVFDIALSLGLEYMIWDSAGVFIRYNLGLCNQFKGQSIAGYEYMPPYGKNRVGQIGIIYKFGQ